MANQPRKLESSGGYERNAEISFTDEAEKYICAACGYVYDPVEHDGVAFGELPDDWKCMRCRQSIQNFARI